MSDYRHALNIVSSCFFLLPSGGDHPHHHHHVHHGGGGGPRRFLCFEQECNCFVTYLMLGMLCFVAFWSLLMLRIYLPEKYWEWSYIWST
jgi:hypothetical protein